MRRRGVTLVELLATAVIIGVTAAPVLMGLSNSYFMAKYTAHRSQAMALVNNKLETLRAQAGNNVLSTQDSTTQQTIGDMGTVTLRTVVTQPQTRLMMFDVTASWSETRNGRTFTESFRLGSAANTNLPAIP